MHTAVDELKQLSTPVHCSQSYFKFLLFFFAIDTLHVCTHRTCTFEGTVSYRYSLSRF